MINNNLYAELYNLRQNERKLLELIWRKQSVARKDLASLTGLTGASATRLTQKILELGLVEESVERQGRRGSPNKPLTLNRRRFVVLGVSFNKEQVTLALSDLFGEILRRETVATDALSVELLDSLIRQFIQNDVHLQQKQISLIGIGIAIPGYRAVSEQQWAVHWDYPALLGNNIQHQLTQSLNVPVTVERDAVAAMWAERLFGQAREQDNFFLLYLAQGVGGCAMLNGLPVTGARGNAGGVGILFPYNRPRPTTEDFKKFTASQSSGDEYPGIGNAEMFVTGWIDSVLIDFRHAIDVITRLYDPALIILGGELPKQVNQQIVTKLAYKMINTGYTAEIAVPEVSASDFDTNLTLVGASALPIATILSGNPGILAG